VLSKNGAHVITESIGEIQASPNATPFKLLLIVPVFCACKKKHLHYKIEISNNIAVRKRIFTKKYIYFFNSLKENDKNMTKETF
jgi:hypothetical protein